MPNSLFRSCQFLTAALAVFAATSLHAAVLNVGSWNMANKPNTATDRTDLSTIFNYVGNTGGLNRPLDVLAMVEMDTASAVDVVTAADSSFGAATYTSLLSTPDGGSDRTGFVYNTATLSLQGSVQLPSTSLTHTILRAKFRPVGTTGNDDFYMYAVHLKSGEATSDKLRRYTESLVLRADAALLGDANIIMGGDFNSAGLHERGSLLPSGINALTDAVGDGQLFDPVNALGDWRDNPAYLSLETNAPGASMDDRFDLQLISNALLDGTGLDYLANSYAVIGNNGTHTLNMPITTGTGAPTEVLSALGRFSDHLPVVAQYSFTLPEPGCLVSVLAVGGMITARRRRA